MRTISCTITNHALTYGQIILWGDGPYRVVHTTRKTFLAIKLSRWERAWLWLKNGADMLVRVVEPKGLQNEH